MFLAETASASASGASGGSNRVAPSGDKNAKSASSPATRPATAPAATLLDREGKPLPPLEKLALAKGDPKHGAAIYRDANTVACIRCHQVADEGGEIGPPLTVVGDKLTPPQILEAIVYPSNGILMGYEDWLVRTKDGDVVEGLLSSETADLVSIKDVNGNYVDIPTDTIASKQQQKQSLMPEGLQAALTQQDLVDLMAYLSSLKAKP